MSAQYDVHKDPHKNIALPDSLLSRFDLLFVVTDDVDEGRDRMIADHVLRMHRYLPPSVEEGTPVHDSLSQPLAIDHPSSAVAQSDEGDAGVFEKYDPLLHIGVAGRLSKTRAGAAKKKQILSVAFIKKYIQYAKNKPAPVLTQGAADHIVQVYADIRNASEEGNAKRVRTVFVRLLETLIRLATAHAKARLSARVEAEDAEQAESILRFALFKEVVRRERRKKRKPGDAHRQEDGEEDEDEEDGEGSADEADAAPERMPVPAKKRTPEPPLRARDPVWDESQAQDGMEVEQTGNAPPAAQNDRALLFRGRVSRLWAGKFQDDDQVFLADLVQAVNEGLSMDELFGTAEATGILEAMTDANELMLSDNIVYKV